VKEGCVITKFMESFKLMTLGTCVSKQTSIILRDTKESHGHRTFTTYLVKGRKDVSSVIHWPFFFNIVPTYRPHAIKSVESYTQPVKAEC